MAVDPVTRDAIEHILDHPDRAVAQLHTWLQDKPRLISVVRGLAAGAQVAEDQLWGLLTSDTPQLATGVSLNRWGRLVGQERGLLQDEDYRRVIQAAVLAQRCPGDGDSLIRIWEVLMQPTASRLVEVFTGGGASFCLYALREAPLSDAMRTRTKALMQLAKPAGIEMCLVEAIGANPLMGFFTADTEGTLDTGLLARIL